MKLENFFKPKRCTNSDPEFIFFIFYRVPYSLLISSGHLDAHLFNILSSGNLRFTVLFSFLILS